MSMSKLSISKQFMSKECRSLIGLLLLGVFVPSFAYESGDIIVRFGPALVAPSSSSDSLLGDIVEADDAEGFGISATYMMTDQFGLELLGALPFEHRIDGTGALEGVKIGYTEQLPPTLMFHYAPSLSESFQPYIGAGVNYTTFFREKTSAELDVALAADTDLSLSDSMGLAVEIGVDIPIGEGLLFNLSVWNIDIDTVARVKANGTRAVTVDVEIDPWVYMVGLGVSF